MATLEITDGTTTIDLAQGDLRVDIDGWGPAIATRRASELAGEMYADVEEPLRLVADGPSPGAQWSELQRLLDQARRWELGDPAAAPVRLRARPDCTRLPAGVVLESLLLGGQAEPYPGNWRRTLPSDVIGPAEVLARRRGAWLNPSYESAASSAVRLQELMTVTFPSAQAHSCALSLAMIQADAAATIGGGPVSGGIVLAPSASAFQIIDAEGMSKGSFPLASVADATARGGAKLRYTASSPAQTTGTITTFARADIYLVAAAHTAGARFRVRPSVWRNAGSLPEYSFIYGDQVIIEPADPSTADLASLYYVGTLAVPPNTTVDRIALDLQWATAADIGAVLDIDTVLVVAHDYGPIYPLLAPYVASERPIVDIGTVAYGSYAASVMSVDHRPLATPNARVFQAPAATPFGPAYRPLTPTGDPALTAAGQTLVGWASMSAVGHIRSNGAIAGTPYTYTYALQARRYPTYLTLE
jgi:hypothetical protein